MRTPSSERALETQISALEEQLEKLRAARKYGECTGLKKQIDYMKNTQTEISSLKVKLEERDAANDFETCEAILNQIDDLTESCTLPLKASVVWKPDSSATQCPHCDSQFGFIFGPKKHHCRKCGDVVCNECSKQRVRENEIFSDGNATPTRVCDICFSQDLRKGQSHSSISGQQLTILTLSARSLP